MVHRSAVASLLDPNRLRVAGALVDATRTTAQLLEHTTLEQREVLKAIGDLMHAGLVERTDDGYTLSSTQLRELASQFAESLIPMDPSIGFGMTDEEQAVLEQCFQGRTLAEIPTSRFKRLIVLERIALEFDLGRHYPERAVNDILKAFNPDISSLRRYLVDEEFLDRADGQYWRSGGRLQAGI